MEEVMELLNKVTDKEELLFIKYVISNMANYDDNTKKNFICDVRNKITKYNLLNEMADAVSYCNKYGHDFSNWTTYYYDDGERYKVKDSFRYCHRCGEVERDMKRYKTIKKKKNR